MSSPRDEWAKLERMKQRERDGRYLSPDQTARLRMAEKIVARLLDDDESPSDDSGGVLF